MIVSELREILLDHDPDGVIVIFPSEIELDDDGNEIMLEPGIGVLESDEDGEIHFIGEAPVLIEVDDDGNEVTKFDISLN